ncbi:MAG: hypothetical protein RBU45_00560 [Myxococcota bacterium]|nr:hypothetical protein [Myxococcota bacterium]
MTTEDPDLPERADLEQGLKYLHLVGESLRNELVAEGGLLYALVDLLIAKGMIRTVELEQPRAEAAARVQQTLAAIPSLAFGPLVDKYALVVAGPSDCLARLPVCRGACCRLPRCLSVQDLQEGGLRWDYFAPYLLGRTPDGRCLHQDAHHRCTVYDRRPAACRSYDCRTDGRIWLDFDRWLVHPDVEQLGRPR